MSVAVSAGDGMVPRTYLFKRRMILSGVLANSMALPGTFFFTSAAMLFSLAGGTLVAPPVGAPGSAAGSDIAVE